MCTNGFPSGSHLLTKKLSAIHGCVNRYVILSNNVELSDDSEETVLAHDEVITQQEIVSTNKSVITKSTTPKEKGKLPY